MRRLAVVLFLASFSASAQIPLAMPQFADPPESNGAPFTTFSRHILWNSGQVCLQRSTTTGWKCLVTDAQMNAAKTDAVTQANNNAAATYMPTATATSAFATMNGRIDGVQATAGGAATQAALDAAIASLSANLSGVQSSVTTLGTRVTATESGASALTSRVGALEVGAATASSLASAVSTLNARIDAAQSAARLCTATTLTGLSIPLTGGLSTATNVTLAGVAVGTTCSVASNNRMPLGATGDPVVTTAGIVSVAFRGNGGLLSAIISIPNGTYRVCCDR